MLGEGELKVPQALLGFKSSLAHQTEYFHTIINNNDILH